MSVAWIHLEVPSLAVGDFAANIPDAISHHLQARHRLVVVGARGWETGPTLQALRSLGDRCELFGYVSDAELAELYRRCAVFCYPSLGEGFGLPVLEAMAAGAAVLTSGVSSLPEVGGQAGGLCRSDARGGYRGAAAGAAGGRGLAPSCRRGRANGPASSRGRALRR